VAAVFLAGSGRLDHCTDPGFAALVGKQRSNQRFTIDLVGYPTSSTASVTVGAIQLVVASAVKYGCENNRSLP
jgi:hypothetical protein